MNCLNTIWADFGSGAPIFGLQASVFTKETICLDLPEVMDQVLRILQDSIPDDVANQHLTSAIHLVSQDILTMKMEELPEISKDLTHITCFIGIPDGL